MDDMTIGDKSESKINPEFATANLSHSFPGARFPPKKRFIMETGTKHECSKKISLLSNTDDDLKPLNWLISPTLINEVCPRPRKTKPPAARKARIPPYSKAVKMMSRVENKKNHTVLNYCRKKVHDFENFPNKLSHLAAKSKLIKPSYSFATMIFMAIESTPFKRMRVKDIYEWIEENFPYYRYCDLGWKLSVRHNLSLNNCFQTVDKSNSRMDCGKGTWWTIDTAVRPELIRAFKKLGNVCANDYTVNNFLTPKHTATTFYHTPPTSPPSNIRPGLTKTSSYYDFDEKHAAATLCFMKNNSRIKTEQRSPDVDMKPCMDTPSPTTGPSSTESSPEQASSLVKSTENPKRRSILIDKRSAEGVWALLSMANSR